MRTNGSPLWCWVLLALVLLTPLVSEAQEAGEVDVESVFFDALDLKENGQCSFAVGRFQLCLQLDPTLHQARLHLAECYQEMGEDALAIREARFYLKADFPEAEVERAKAVVSACGGDPELIPAGGKGGQPPAEQHGAGETEQPGPDPEPAAAVDKTPTAKTPRGFPGDRPRRWSRARLGTGLLVTHFANETKLTALGPMVDLRFLAGQFIEFGVFGRVALGPHPAYGGTVTVPQFGGAIAVSIPLRGPRLTAGVLIPAVLSGIGDETRADGGILGEVGIHFPAGDTPLVIEALFEGGYLVSPVIGGRVGLSFQLGPKLMP